jgi:hypothetical protein
MPGSHVRCYRRSNVWTLPERAGYGAFLPVPAHEVAPGIGAVAFQGRIRREHAGRPARTTKSKVRFWHVAEVSLGTTDVR